MSNEKKLIKKERTYLPEKLLPESNFKGTPTPHTLQVLEEDNFLEKLDRIVEKDFFPNLKLLKQRNFELGSLEDKIALVESSNSTGINIQDKEGLENSEAKPSSTDNLSLNDFLDKYTSEDNARYPLTHRRV